MKTLVLPFFSLQEKKCKFNHLCNLYSNSSYTCTHVGGGYCGKYRALTQTTKNKITMKVNRNLTQDTIVQ
ncbi:MAG: hypothetical protein ABSA75_04540 [Candidatus Bathyarchaeia archaeon]